MQDLHLTDQPSVLPRLPAANRRYRYAEPAGLRDAGSIRTSGSTAASQLPSLINELLFIAEMLPICIIQAGRQDDDIGPQQL